MAIKIKLMSHVRDTTEQNAIMDPDVDMSTGVRMPPVASLDTVF